MNKNSNSSSDIVSTGASSDVVSGDGGTVSGGTVSGAISMTNNKINNLNTMISRGQQWTSNHYIGAR